MASPFHVPAWDLLSQLLVLLPIRADVFAHIVEYYWGLDDSNAITIVVFGSNHTHFGLYVGSKATIRVFHCEIVHIWLEDEEAKIAGVSRLRRRDVQFFGLALGWCNHLFLEIDLDGKLFYRLLVSIFSGCKRQIALNGFRELHLEVSCLIWLILIVPRALNWGKKLVYFAFEDALFLISTLLVLILVTTIILNNGESKVALTVLLAIEGASESILLFIFALIAERPLRLELNLSLCLLKSQAFNPQLLNAFFRIYQGIPMVTTTVLPVHL